MMSALESFGFPTQILAVRLLVLLDGLSAGILMPILPFLVLSLHGSPGAAALLVGVYGCASFIGGPIVGGLSDTFGRVQVIVCALLVSIASYVGLLLSSSLVLLFTFRIMTGASTGRGAVINALVTDGVPPERHPVELGWLSAAGAVGAALGPGIGGLSGMLFGDIRVQVRMLFACTAVATAVVLLIFMLAWRGRKLPPPVLNPGSSFLLLRGALSIRRPVFVVIFSSYAWGVVISITALLANARFGWGPFEAGCVFSAGAVIAGLTEAALVPWLVKHFGTVSTLSASLVIGAPALLILGIATSKILLLTALGISIVAVSIALIVPTIMVSTGAAGDHRGTLMGALHAFSDLALFTSASISGFLFDRLGIASPYVAAAICLLIAMTFPLIDPQTKSVALADHDEKT